MHTRTYQSVALLAIGLNAAALVGCDSKALEHPVNKPFPSTWSTPAPAPDVAPSTPAKPVAAKQDAPPAPARAAVLNVGDKLPNLTFKNAQNQDVNLTAPYAEQPIVLTVYRGGWSPYCVTNLEQWQDKLEQVTALGAAIIAISPESSQQVATTVGKDALAYTVLSDSTGSAIKALGLAFILDDTTQAKYKGFGVDLSKLNADGTWELPHSATYVVDTTGVIRYVYVNEDYKTRANVDEVFAAISKMGFVPAKPSAITPTYRTTIISSILLR